MARKQYGTAAQYAQAFVAIVQQGLPDKHFAMLQVHASARGGAISWRELASKVGYRNAEAVKLQYGLLAHRVANGLDIFEPPGGYWLNVLAFAVAKPDSEGHLRFALRRPALDGASKAGLLEPKRGGLTTRSSGREA